MHRPLFNGWRLFGWVFALQCAVLAAVALRSDLGQGAAVSSMIALSVQVSVPCLYLAFAASASALLFPGEITRWLLRNRRMFGLAYAAGMGWQAVFILWLVTGHFDYYKEVANNPYDLVEEVPGYVFLIAMTATSFAATRRWLGPNRWKLLHTVGIYYLWGETWGTYWYYAFYYPDAQPIYHVYYWAGLLAWGLRIAAMYTRESVAARGVPSGSSRDPSRAAHA